MPRERGWGVQPTHIEGSRSLRSGSGTTSLKIYSPATSDSRELKIDYNSAERLFIGSAMKAFFLCERLRQLDSPDVVQKISEHQQKLDTSVWILDSRTFNPPNLSGLVAERTAMEAMIAHSDNTATDMVIAQAGRQNVQQLLQQADLTSSTIPDSTRIFFGYSVGAPDYKTFTWQELISRPDGASIVNPRSMMSRLSPHRAMISYRFTRDRRSENSSSLQKTSASSGAYWRLPTRLSKE